MKYNIQAKINECGSFARSLGVKCRVSTFGISILSPKPKFFSSQEIYMDNGEECKKYIKKVAPSLQTKLRIN